MRLLILGGTGFISGAVAQLARERGMEVFTFHRSEGASVQGDIDELPRHAAALQALHVDAVIHCIAYTEQHAHDAAVVFADHRLVVLSSQDCYELFDQTRQQVSYGDFPVDEGAPTASRRHYYAGTSHKRAETYDKNLMTEALQGAHPTATVLRLPMVWGPRDHQVQHRHGSAIWHVLDQQPMVMGAVEQSTLWTFGYIDNIAAGILHALDSEQTRGRIYNLGETRWRTHRQWAQLYGDAAGFEVSFHIVADHQLHDTPPDDPAPHLLMDNRAFEADTGFVPPVDIAEGVARTLAWARQDPSVLGERPNYAERMALTKRSRGT